MGLIGDFGFTISDFGLNSKMSETVQATNPNSAIHADLCDLACADLCCEVRDGRRRV